MKLLEMIKVRNEIPEYIELYHGALYRKGVSVRNFSNNQN
jgi:hypothetical protein